MHVEHVLPVNTVSREQLEMGMGKVGTAWSWRWSFFEVRYCTPESDQEKDGNGTGGDCCSEDWIVDCSKD
jgi:hypothetical protein